MDLQMAHFIIPPPPPPHLPCVELPISGLKLEASHAEHRNGVLESIKEAGGYGKIILKHVPPNEQHTPEHKHPSSLKPIPKGGKVDLMGDLNAALLKRKMGGGTKRGGGVKMGNTMRMLGGGLPLQTLSTPQKKKEIKKEEIDDDATDF